MTDAYVRRVVALLAGQAFAFGLSESLLLITANAIFLDAYGSKWLPLTYIGIAVVGTLLAAGVARTVRRWPLPRVAVATEAGVALVFLGAWAVLRGGGVWVSAPLLVLFPVLIQIGFVFVGGQAGRLLDLQRIKARFPRIVAGFAVGFAVGGLLGTRLISLLGSTDDLLLVAVGAQAAFVVLLAAAAARFPDSLGHVERSALALPRPPIRRLLSSRFVLLVIGYQALSAGGTQLVEYLFFDRAAARYHDSASLAQFLSKYTALLNVVDMLFLALAAGLLLRRFGLRLGIAANSGAVTALMVAMLVVTTASGPEALAVFVLVATARLVDICLTDGTTRTWINTAYQVLPAEERLTVQSTVEGAVVPIAVGVAGVVLFAMRALGASVAVIVGVTAAACLVWSLAGVLLYRDYARSIVAAFRRRLLPDAVPDLADAGAAAAVQRLLASDDGNDVRLGLDLVAGSSSPCERAELTRLAGDRRPDVRVPALVALGDDGAIRLDAEIATLAASPDAGERRIAAQALAAPAAAGRAPLAGLLHDPDPGVRAAALAAVSPADASLVPDVVAALRDPATLGAAADAVGRLGDAVLPALQSALDAVPTPAPPATLRLVRAARAASRDRAAACLGPHVEHPDRELGLVVLTALASAGADPAPLAGPLERTLRADAGHASRCLSALAAVEPAPLLERALRDELDLLRQRVLALLAVRHGAEPMRVVTLGLGGSDDGRRSLALEMLEVTLARGEAAQALPVVRADLPDDERRRLLEHVAPAPAADRAAVLADLVEDGEARWRSPWLHDCAAYEAAAHGRAHGA